MSRILEMKDTIFKMVFPRNLPVADVGKKTAILEIAINELPAI
jgi:hypothetical protein